VAADSSRWSRWFDVTTTGPRVTVNGGDLAPADRLALSAATISSAGAAQLCAGDVAVTGLVTGLREVKRLVRDPAEDTGYTTVRRSRQRPRVRTRSPWLPSTTQSVRARADLVSLSTIGRTP